MPELFKIEFDYTLEGISKTIRLSAQVEIHHSETHYIVTTIRKASDRNVLPDQDLKRAKGKWVHRDSGRTSFLSEAIGSGIDKIIANNHRFGS